jgi:hypothetical protein
VMKMNVREREERAGEDGVVGCILLHDLSALCIRTP